MPRREILSPGERRIVHELEPYPLELALVLELIEELDAHLVPEEEPPRARRYRRLSRAELDNARQRAEVIAP